ncbi:MAG: hypothetical protein IT379_04265 [Deltaproteobacteria bacterium]|nr:hypothetical protein [Deltaproteobacteria bacterium]
MLISSKHVAWLALAAVVSVPALVPVFAQRRVPRARSTPIERTTLDELLALAQPAPRDAPAPAIAITRMMRARETEQHLATAPLAYHADGTPVMRGNYELQAVRTGNVPRIVFRLTLSVAGQPPMDAAFKPLQAYYHDWLGEVLCGRAARDLGIPIVPVAERSFPLSTLQLAMMDAPPGYLDIVRTMPGSEEVPGSISYWVPGMQMRIGQIPYNGRGLRRIAQAMTVADRQAVLANPLLRQAGAMIVLDFLTANFDRTQNAGTLRPSQGDPLLVLFDNGFSFLYHRHFMAHLGSHHIGVMELFPRQVVTRARAWTHESVGRMLSLRGAGRRLRPHHVREAIERRDRLVQRVEEVRAIHGDSIFY